MTTAGLYGRIVELSDDNMYLQVAPGVELKFARGAVARKVSGGELGPDADEELEEEQFVDQADELDELDRPAEPPVMEEPAPDEGKDDRAR